MANKEGSKPRSRRRDSGSKEAVKKGGLGAAAKAAIIIAIIVAALFAVYAFLANYYHTHFLPGSTVNGVEVDGMEAAEVKEIIQSGLDKYVLTVNERGGQEKIDTEGISLKYVDRGEVEQLLDSQENWSWISYFFHPTEIELYVDSSFDEPALTERVKALEMFTPERITAPTNAYMTDDAAAGKKVIIPETEGCTPDQDKVIEVILEAVRHRGASVDLEADDCYIHPDIYTDDEELNRRVNEWNKLLSSAGLTYDFSDRKEVIDYPMLMTMIVDDGTNISVNRDVVADLVQQWKEVYDTFGRRREFKTHDGYTVEITDGDYGWVIDKEKTTDKIVNNILNGEYGIRQPEYSYTAMSRDVNDIGGTYAEICLSEQHMWVYEDGEVVVSTSVVTGNPTKGNGTHTGVFAIDGKISPWTLKGEGYERVVTYWLPFNGNEGIHEATWRDSFGGDIYLYAGSHGCVNTPPSVMEDVFNVLEIGYPVVVYD